MIKCRKKLGGRHAGFQMLWSMELYAVQIERLVFTSGEQPSNQTLSCKCENKDISLGSLTFVFTGLDV